SYLYLCYSGDAVDRGYDPRESKIELSGRNGCASGVCRRTRGCHPGSGGPDSSLACFHLSFGCQIRLDGIVGVSLRNHSVLCERGKAIFIELRLDLISFELRNLSLRLL